MNESSAERSEKVKAEIDKLKKRNAELDQMYIRLYEDYSSGKLSEKKFTMMSLSSKSLSGLRLSVWIKSVCPQSGHFKSPLKIFS